MGVLVSKLVEEFGFKMISQGPLDTEITFIENNRSGLQLTGFYDYFENKRIQIIGNAENAFLQTIPEIERVKAVEKLIAQAIPCVIITNNLTILDNLHELGQKYNRWILSTDMTTSQLSVATTLFLRSALAESISYHGVLVDVFGLGVLLTGESGIGKSETALDLIRKGHLLIADDAVIIKKIGSEMLVGYGTELTKNLMEIRGIGIININSLFGKSAIRLDKTIDVVMNLEKWDEASYYDRVGESYDEISILDVLLPLIKIPVKPGRNLAAIVEIAALNYRQNLMGYNAARELSNAIKKLSE